MAKTATSAFKRLAIENFLPDRPVIEALTSTDGGSLERCGRNINAMFRSHGCVAMARYLLPITFSSSSYATSDIVFEFKNFAGQLSVYPSVEYTCSAAGGRTFTIKAVATDSTSTYTDNVELASIGAATSRTKADMNPVVFPAGSESSDYWIVEIQVKHNGAGSGSLSIWGVEFGNSPAATTTIPAGRTTQSDHVYAYPHGFVGYDTTDQLLDTHPADVYSIRRMHYDMMFLQRANRNQLFGQNFYPELFAAEPSDPAMELDGGDYMTNMSRMVLQIPIIPRRNTGKLTYYIMHRNPHYAGDASSSYSISEDRRSIWIESHDQSVMVAGNTADSDIHQTTGTISIPKNRESILTISCGKIGETDANGGSYGGLKIVSLALWEADP